jgi:hypothetical protein
MGLVLAESLVAVFEGETDPEPHNAYVALQGAINGGLWGLQGSYGRAMMAAIEAGHCMLGRTATVDYWGNRIPSRDQVKPGSKGSVEYVRARAGDAWAEYVAAL